jgi:prephenate dehydrogenase
MEWLKVLKDLRDFLEYGLGTQLVYFKTWKAHDEEMALQQAVVHRVILTLGKMVDASPCTTYVGKQICNLRLRIQQGDYGLYKIIQENPYLSEKLCDFGGNLSHFHLEKHMKKCGDK